MMQMIFAALIVLAVFLIWAYNRGVGLKNYVAEAFSTMDVYLKKRWDLLPNLIEVVKAYTAHEKNLLTELTELRSRNYNSLSNAEKVDVNSRLGQVLPKITAVAENYPDLKANQSYMLLMEQMNNIEDDIANARKYYNGTVRELNNYCDIFPTNLVAAFFNTKRAKMFEIESGERQNIKTEL